MHTISFYCGVDQPSNGRMERVDTAPVVVMGDWDESRGRARAQFCSILSDPLFRAKEKPKEPLLRKLLIYTTHYRFLTHNRHPFHLTGLLKVGLRTAFSHISEQIQKFCALLQLGGHREGLS